MSKKVEVTVKKRFVISRSLLGKGLVIEFTNKKGETYKYDHDEVFAKNQEKILSMPCFNEYGNYTNTNKLPKWAE
tara:strand:+ start:125 stop:349 length:225 start_codon:yes stop_codon:yes gene_type:complete